MAAGLGFKTFTTGEVLTAADTNGYLMQGVLVFADAAARDAAITAPAEGQFAYLKDSDTTTYYTSSAWANLDTTGMVNPMTTTGDTIYSSSGSTPARLAIGATSDVLTVAGGVPTWAAPAAAASGLTLITRNTFSNVAAVTLDSIFSATYKAYRVVIEDVYAATQTNPLYMQLRYSGATETGSTYAGSSYGVDRDGSAVIITNSDFATQFSLSVSSGGNATDSNSSYSFTISKVGVSGNPSWNGTGFNGYVYRSLVIGGLNSQTRTYDGMVLKASASNITGTISIYGLGI